MPSVGRCSPNDSVPASPIWPRCAVTSSRAGLPPEQHVDIVRHGRRPVGPLAAIRPTSARGRNNGRRGRADARHRGRPTAIVVDRGFQVLNTGGSPAVAPSASTFVDALVSTGSGLDPWSGAGSGAVDPGGRSGLPGDRPAATPTALLGSHDGTDRLAPREGRDRRLLGPGRLQPVDRLLAAPEHSAEEALRRAGVGDALLERFFRPFLAGVLLEDDLATSSRYVDLLWRSFVRGAIGLPADGMQAVGRQLADRLDPAAALAARRCTVAPGSVGVDGRNHAGPRGRRRHRSSDGRPTPSRSGRGPAR